jgi:hypothetical protein
MDVSSIIADLTEDEYGWQVTLPTSLGRFFGHAVRLEIETRPVAEEGAPPVVSPEETALAKTILANLPAILADAEKKFTRYTDGDADAKEQIRDPHIWINRDEFEDSEDDEEDMERWTFVVGREDAPDFGYHIEFDGRKCLEIWAGD